MAESMKYRRNTGKPRYLCKIGWTRLVFVLDAVARLALNEGLELCPLFGPTYHPLHALRHPPRLGPK